ncbi:MULTISPECIES: alpha/beta hydrolase family protein [Pseudonocardia]|uniref:Alpha/beta hydrolase family protein n=2 Tax=Pseudonocardia TaxID=1847 RepID=A0A1Y2N4N9_PSEAH|nr:MULTISPECIES: alpha/beta hydrolase [Pseudonocardia]OSY42131.1 Alpha/beta hydrolase family protein [Pseudonocardia autotrophica]TDN75101.1 hypothetical protein C8E95_4244 [Pseudonocardia autotrophica]BBF99046.1 peptidase [Pseudonocardia autotrophica]GEC23966.1 peptidase [Pseudonocardia saturnea]
MTAHTGTAAGVPFTALAPEGIDGPAPLLLTWHMLDAPRTDAAFAAALPMSTVPAWRVHLAMPMCGARMVDGSLDAAIALARDDVLLSFLAPFTRQAAAELPDVVTDLRAQLPTDDGPVSLLGGSLGGAVVLRALTAGEVPVRAAALVNPAVRLRSVVPLVEGLAGRPYRWTPEADRVADELDFVARAGELADRPPLLIVSGEDDHPALRADAEALQAAVRTRHGDARLVTVPGLAHPLAEEPGLEPAPQTPAARAVDGILVNWFSSQLEDASSVRGS